jgi:hypothetical protein
VRPDAFAPSMPCAPVRFMAYVPPFGVGLH